MNRTKFKLLLTASFALFAMFFGSGNLLYPIAVGVESGNGYLYSLIGLLGTGVLIPFLGLAATIMSLKKNEDFFEPLGRPVNLGLSLLMLSLMGPFGVGARCVLIASSGIELLVPQVPAQVLGFIFLAFCGFLLLKTKSIVDVIGRWLTPLLLLGLIGIICASLSSTGTPVATSFSDLENFKLGSLKGYQMMDLLAAVFFGRSIHVYLQSSSDIAHSTKNKLSLWAGVFGACMLASLYAGLVAVGANHSLDLASVDPQQRLATIADLVLGPMALTATSLIIALACLTTLCILMELFANFIRTDLLPGKMSRTTSILLTLGITFIVSLAGFFTLATWIGIALQVIYPALIVFSILRMLEAADYLSKRNLQILSGLSVVLCLLTLI